MQLTTANPATVEQRSKTTIDLLTRSIHDLRNLSKSINGTYMLEQGLEKAVERELGFISQTGAIQTELHWPEQAMEFSGQLEIVVFRAIQEALKNAVKHAEASQIRVSGAQSNEQIGFEVSCKGKGMDMGLSL